MDAGGGVERAAPGMGAPLQIGGLYQLYYVPTSRDSMTAPWIHLDDVHPPGLEQPSVALHVPLVFSGADVGGGGLIDTCGMSTRGGPESIELLDIVK